MPTFDEWIGTIRRGIWESFSSSAPEIVDDIGRRAAQIVKQKTGKWGKPTGRLANALEGKDNYSESLSKTDTEIVAERTIDLPYAWAIEKGNFYTNVTPAVRGRMLRLFKETKDPKYIKAFLSKKTKWFHKAYPYLEPAIQQTEIGTLVNIFEKHFVKELSKIPNMEITLGT